MSISATTDPRIAVSDLEADCDSQDLMMGMFIAQTRLAIWQQCMRMADCSETALRDAKAVEAWVMGDSD